jgi:hypothetical protein
MVLARLPGIAIEDFWINRDLRTDFGGFTNGSWVSNKCSAMSSTPPAVSVFESTTTPTRLSCQSP